MHDAEGGGAYDFLFKVILIGDPDVGKTCIVQRFKSGIFLEKQRNTIGVDFAMKTVDMQGKRIKLQIWDTAGQERFKTITQSYYRSANGAVLAYDITSRPSFLSVPRWIDDINRYAGHNLVQLLIGNKLDMAEGRQVSWEEGQELARRHGMLAALETSAKEADNVDEVFLRLAAELLARNGGPSVSDSRHGSIKLDSRAVGAGWGCGC
ncbi:ras-related protein Rab-43 [Lethenteron reissneri]|uniref:ras-related protein Rab-43 n=1 Tax=Lethenteron reissneri TaxID=7753 RepID=UPI002AB6ECF0|nr:ras-related protein Rab-43 [Lethenteron reissneri]